MSFNEFVFVSVKDLKVKSWTVLCDLYDMLQENSLKEVQILKPQVHFCSYCFETFKKTSISTELDFWVLVFVHILLIFCVKKKDKCFLKST